MEFASSIDFVDNDQLKKTVLLSTSTYSSNMQSPARVSLNILKENPDPNQFRKRNQALAILLEGEFHSVFKNRIPTEIRENKSIDFKELSKPSQIIVIGDGDLISNFVSRKGAYYPLGFDRYTNQTYGNKTFFLNAVDYMLGYTNILELRNKEYKIRLLDSRKAESKPLQYAGVLAPLVLVLIFAIIFQQARKKRFSR